jgi:hypothetical protein
MKRLLAFLLALSLLVVTGTLVAADGQTRRRPESKFGSEADTGAIIKRGAAVGALLEADVINRQSEVRISDKLIRTNTGGK